MLKHFLFVITVSLFLLASPKLHAQQAEAPKYKDGDWWRVKVEFTHKGGFSRSGLCSENYPEYVVKIDQGKAKIFGLSGANQEEIDCPLIESQLLDSGSMRRGLLQFPLSVGKGWNYRYQTTGRRGQLVWNESSAKVTAWEKVKLPQAEFEAFKIESYLISASQVIHIVHYAPRVKAIILWNQDTTSVNRTVTLVNFNVSP